VDEADPANAQDDLRGTIMADPPFDRFEDISAAVYQRHGVILLMQIKLMTESFRALSLMPSKMKRHGRAVLASVD
jgi:hypothetical protein